MPTPDETPWIKDGQPVLPPSFTPCPALPAANFKNPEDAPKIKALIDQYGPEHVCQGYWEREMRIAQANADPLNYGFDLKWYDNADAQWAECAFLMILGGNGSGKTRYMSRKVVEYALRYPGARIWCFSQTEDVSNQLQQPFIYDYIPAKLQKARKTKTTNITYSIKGGFTENACVFPNGSTIRWKFYAQGVGTLEGPGVDLIWFDEEAPLSFIETAAYRLSRATAIWPEGGKMFLTFTPIDGYTATVKACLTGARTLQEVEAPLLEREKDGKKIPEMVPVIQEGPKGRIIYAHTSQNPFINYQRMVKEEFKRATREQILCRAYGVPTKPLGVQFPRFREHVHVKTMDEGKAILSAAEGIDWYHSCDPSPGRNWFQCWAAAIPGRLIVVREWPQEDDWIPGVGFVGPWAEPSEKPDGKPGPAQKKFGFGYRQYLDEIARVENEIAKWLERDDIRLFERIMDSRAAASPRERDDGTTTLLDEVNDAIDATYDDLAIYPDFSTAGGGKEAEGIEMINDALAFNEDAPITQLNHPELIILEPCTNIRYSLAEYTGLDGMKAANKDPIDVLRYLKVKQADYIGSEAMETTGGGAY